MDRIRSTVKKQIMKTETGKFITDSQRDFFLKQKSINAWSELSGIPYASIHGFFTKKRYLTVQSLVKLCNAAGITVDEFLKL